MNKGAITAAIIGGLVTLGVGTIAYARGGIRSFAPGGGKPSGNLGPSSTPSPSPTPTATPSRALVTVRDSVIYGPTGEVRITDQDARWLGRAITGEVGPRASREAMNAVSWALAQNLMLVGSSPPRFRTFAGMVLAYCQPVNPIWADVNSSKCRRSPQRCTPALISRRRGFRALPWENLSSQVRQAVEAFRSGSTTNPVPGMVDWHANSFRGALREVGGNWFGTGSGRRVIRA